MHANLLISLVVVTRDRKTELKRCLESVFRQNYRRIEVLVVDNRSVDGTVEMLRTEFPAVKLIRLDRNLGCPGARNIGVLNAQGEIIFFLDDDCVIDADTIDRALPHFEMDDQLAIVTPQIIEPNTGKTLLNRGDIARYAHDFTGVSAFRRNVFDNFGLYPADFLYGAEETDLALRILNGDQHILHDPRIKVFHYPAGNRNRNWEIEQRLLNAMRVLIKYAPPTRLLAGILIKPLIFLRLAFHYHSVWGWIKAVFSIPILLIKILASGQRTPLGWKPFLLSEFLIKNSITSREDLARVDENQLKPSIFASSLPRRFLGKYFREV